MVFTPDQVDSPCGIAYSKIAHCVTRIKWEGVQMITMHPGEYLMLSYVEPFQLSQRELARRLGVSTAAISRLLAQKADLTPDMAVRLESVFDQSAESWMSMQVAHSLVRARKTVQALQLQPFSFGAAVRFA
ncbi:MAG: HigA family addiction module antitoxin [Sphingomonadaceae bacterium]